MTERRAHRRYELLAQVQVSRQSVCHVMATVNVSRGGLFLDGDPRDYPDLMVGTDVELLIFDADAPEEEAVTLAAVVVRVETDGQLGFGLQFTNVDAGSLVRFHRFLRAKGVPV
ncbi:MAG: PilZ domain-containing protein [Deltaproteobacteria bacterium]|nr:PilZ domain-containing protein [Deltaproteobacteria bacterium]